MLQSYLNEWANARKNAVILEEQKDENENLMLQRAEVVFQGVKIEIRNKRVTGAHEPTQGDKFCAEFFIPSTLTLISDFRNSEYPSTEFIATILEAIDPDYESKQRDVVKRRRISMDELLSGKKQEWTDALTDTKYDQAEANFIIDFAINLLKRDRVDNIDMFIQTMVKYQDNILDNGIVKTMFDGTEITGMDVLYDLLCRCCSKRALAENNKFIVSQHGAEYVFLDDSHDDRLTAFTRSAMNVLRAIFADCNKYCSMFTTVAYGMASFYAFKFNEPITYRLAKVSERRSLRKPGRNNSVSAMMTSIAGVIENAQPIKKKSKKG